MKSEINLDNNWTSHASGCATSPWNDGFDAARVALFPFVCSKAKLSSGMDEGDRIIVFGTSNCTMSAGSRNPIGLCFAGDILINDIAKTGEMLTNVPFRVKFQSSSTPTVSTPFEWSRFIPKQSSNSLYQMSKAKLTQSWMQSNEEQKSCVRQHQES